ncbi:hypothetical protein C450_09122 [Halococcus salifodinae DSM 8989]|uniref:Uncharacterized protein n=1 Tax=Halococcus salifodinae DSM 8989 TaxID=1227456 RepID=M0N6G8_9EURY|nr:hypothetical protein C450_09122 [Halococcus salifodinae DSM 8989]
MDITDQNGAGVGNETVVITDAITGEQVFNGATNNAGQIETNLSAGSYNVEAGGTTKIVTVVGGSTVSLNFNVAVEDVPDPTPLEGSASTPSFCC